MVINGKASLTSEQTLLKSPCLPPPPELGPYISCSVSCSLMNSYICQTNQALNNFRFIHLSLWLAIMKKICTLRMSCEYDCKVEMEPVFSYWRYLRDSLSPFYLLRIARLWVIHSGKPGFRNVRLFILFKSTFL